MASESPPHRNRPALAHLLGEAIEFMRIRSGSTIGALADGHDGGGRPVLLVPGFLAGEKSMLRLRNTLRAANYVTFGWRQGMNLGVTGETLPRLERRLEEIHRVTGREISLIGWSMGGLIARELAKLRPDCVEQVVTLGSPFSGDPRQNRIWWLYELVAGHKVDAPPIECALGEKPPVETVALWSRRDGVVAPACACGRHGEADRTIEVDSSHLGMVSAPSAMAGTLEALGGRKAVSAVRETAQPVLPERAAAAR